jgi:monothiol glutaredoxin
MTLTPQLKEQIESIIASHKVVLFMKGTREQPQCGFSATVVGLLNQLISSYHAVDILADPLIREGIKEFSSWPTIPQLYINQEFIGGCDIVREMFNNGDLFDVLKLKKPKTITPTITITSAATDALKNALEDAPDGESIRLKIDVHFEHNLSIGLKQPNDIEVHESGVLLFVDPISASRADGITIDYVSSGLQGSGFEIKNPNSPSAVKNMTVKELKQKLDAKEKLYLFDVRTKEEWDQSHIAGATFMMDVPQKNLDALDKDALLIFQCGSGSRSARAADKFLQQGFRNVYNLTGGIGAWAKEIDSSLKIN